MGRMLAHMGVKDMQHGKRKTFSSWGLFFWIDSVYLKELSIKGLCAKPLYMLLILKSFRNGSHLLPSEV